ncbi:MAG TPA: hypothetical protein VM915_16600 [Verrucomicrobiae bacterium]|nr:hypothetical protein [Verrucomicrobiae bacterium]
MLDQNGKEELFVDHDSDQQRRTGLITEVAALDVPHAVCARVAHEIVPNVIKLFGGRPNWAMREREDDKSIRYRGPLPAAREDVLKKFPFEARLAAFAAKSPEQKRGFWPFK